MTDHDHERIGFLGTGIAARTLAAWLVVVPVAVSLVAVVLQYVPSGPAPILWTTFLSQLPFWFAWALFTPAIFAASSRWRFERTSWRRSLLVHVLLALVVSAAVMVTTGGLGLVLGLSIEDFLPPWIGMLGMMMLIYSGIVGLHHSLVYRAAYHREAERKLRMEADLARARLETIQSQLQPHFLFNSLNTISALITREPKAARLAVVHLSDLLRAALQRTELREVPLADEVRFARSYLEIQRLRFGDRLELDIDVEATTLQTPVPPMLLQPILENAFRHGLPDEGPALIELHASRRADGVRLAVRDNGRGFGSAPPVFGKGLAAVASLLDHVRAGRYRLAFEDRPGGGGAVVIDLLEPSGNER